MNRQLFVMLTMGLLGGVSYAKPQGPSEPVCHGVAGQPRWSSKVIEKHIIRFIIDATDVDTCTQYYDLEFVAILLNSKGVPITTSRFALPGVEFRGPGLQSFDFKYQSQEIGGVKGLALHCKKRHLGGLPAPETDGDPSLLEARLLREGSEAERKSYARWFAFAEPDYSESHILRSSEMVCQSGSTRETGKKGDSSSCPLALRAAAETLRKRNEQYGASMSP